MRRRPLRTLLAAAVAVMALPAAPAVADGPVPYYVSAQGNDEAAGTEPAAAWRTLGRASAATLGPGDQVLLEGGVTHTGTLALDPGDAGTAAAPIVVTGYGSGRPRIDAGDGTAISISDIGGVTVHALDVVGSGRTTNRGSGISAYSWRTPATLEGLTVTDVTARGFGGWGVIIGSDRDAGGYAGVRIDRVDASANGEGGILTWAAQPRTHRDVRITRSRAFSNPGVPGLRKNSGNGIVIGSAAGGLIEECVAAYNGGLNTYVEGGAGIWTYDSDAVVIQRNESHHNRTGGPTDGDGFDLDQNTTNAVVQHNYSHDNDGAGFLLAHGPSGGAHRGNVVRFNISENDGRRNGYGA
ncbi:MAG TPA: right-handed parallel beta-helix repeat-containing protein, partial [Cryptosporangiaceae bacterium]|nr:right-handed parallel beta-helix repeat-containing protein [Cryptosporangiaceae bacterium]